MKKRRSKSPIKKQVDRYYKKERDSKPRWEHEYGVWRKVYTRKMFTTYKWSQHLSDLGYHCIDNHRSKWNWVWETDPSYKDKPKRKRHAYLPEDYNFYHNEPKWWRKTFHIKKFRAANRRYMVKMQVLPQGYYDGHYILPFMYLEGFLKSEVHPHDGVPEPLWNKPHRYYW